MFGGLAAIVDSFLNTYETQIYMKDVTIDHCETIKAYAIGGFVGS